MLNFEQIKEKVKEISKKNQKEPIISVAQAADKVSLEAIKMANDQGLAKGLLFGDADEIHKIAEEIGLDPNENEIIDIKSVPEAALKAVEACSLGKADILCKGHLHTNTFLRAVLNKEVGLRTGKILSSVTGIDSKALGRMILASDCAMIINPNMDEKVAIINHATELSEALENPNPKISMLSAVEELNKNMPDGYDAAVITQMNRRGQIKGCVVDGPLSLDLSISPYSAQNKHIDSPVAGHADVLIMPNIQAGNIFWKSMTYLADSPTGAVVMGASKPIVLTSRSDSSQNKFDSIAMALLLSYYQTGLK